MEKHKGSCHCGAVRYEAELDLTQPVLECNCSHCSAKGMLLSFAPEENFSLISGEDSLATYHFNKHVIDHLFCKTCGVQAFGKGSDPSGKRVVAVNVRSIDGVDLTALTRMPFDGKSV